MRNPGPKIRGLHLISRFRRQYLGSNKTAQRNIYPDSVGKGSAASLLRKRIAPKVMFNKLARRSLPPEYFSSELSSKMILIFTSNLIYTHPTPHLLGLELLESRRVILPQPTTPSTMSNSRKRLSFPGFNSRRWGRGEVLALEPTPSLPFPGV